MVLDVIVIVALLCVVAFLAVRFGHDSRETAHSKEEQLAALGVVWEARIDARPRRVVPRRRLRRLRRALASSLLFVADRLDPRPLELRSG
jgi:hypothetical protein